MHQQLTPNKIVTISINGRLAVSASRLVTPDSFNKFPKNNIPNSGKAPGAINVVKSNPMREHNSF
jgi:hypothetical protein